MKIAIVGSRGFDDYEYFCEIIDPIVKGKSATFVSGGARGADSFAEDYANEHGLAMIVFPAEWDKHGKAAGFIRNITIWDNAELGVAFWDGESKGTAHSFGLAKKQKKDLLVVNYTTRELEMKANKE